IAAHRQECTTWQSERVGRVKATPVFACRHVANSMLARAGRRSRSWVPSGVLDSVKGRGDVRVRDEFRKSRFQLIDASLQLLRKNMKAMDSSHTIVQAGTAVVRFLLSVGDNGGGFLAISAQGVRALV